MLLSQLLFKQLNIFNQMAISKALILELKHEINNTRRILERLSDEHLDWRPHEKSMTLGALAAHIVELHNWTSGAITKEVFDFKVDYAPFKVTNVQQLGAKLNEGEAANIEALEGISDEAWMTEWTLKAGDWVIAQMPKAAAIRYIVNNHIVHHRGQLTVYLRLLNIPVPGLYGPSADDAQ